MNLVFIRHGLSKWNVENRFTGWIDVPLAEEGEVEANNKAKNILEKELFTPDIIFTSYLKRAIQSAEILFQEIPENFFIKDWRLNERHYGSLQGLNKKDTSEKYGETKVLEWRRSYRVVPPLLDEDSDFNPNHSELYKDVKDTQPLGESLEDVVNRVKPILDTILSKSLNNNVAVVAHGNSIRAILKILDDISDQDIIGVNIPTAVPIAYEIKSTSINRIGYLGDKDEILQATKEVAQQALIENKED